MMEFIANLFKSLLNHLPAKVQTDHDVIWPTRLESFALRQVQGGSLIFLNGTHLPRHLEIDGREPQAIVFRQPLPSDHEEALLGMNLRKVNPAVDVLNDGPCSGIVRVLATFIDCFGQHWLGNGSGVVIDSEHVMTVGHTIWHREYGLAVSITICRDSRAGPDIYHVDAGAVHFQWAEASSAKNDFAILRTSNRFQSGIKPMRYTRSPTALATTNVNVYGFSTDMPMDQNGYWHPHLSYSYATVECVPDTYGLLGHNGDTYQGASGGPAVDNSGVVIALHRGSYSSGNDTSNRAVAVNQLGNDIEKFKEALAVMTEGTPVGVSRITQGAKFGLRGWIGACFRWE
ncbi:trypsin-like cysteine/serine peptidase domain-containing protein [Annulohypoxylon truncatum]|uniref:trypsin-like cysteine/serine peptidase domain-containing protein n=1 Tax=Annulohypoxylon truncatum TaxID=327061 RepID=UPI0020072863|nr:trypsin-like cysteine/serine peptidase domain-containing protein [Annulohypoxylon truncatum]KAI1206719.1 trypsin-like cysteine/serine peptidase domain-containing protein [Annulohypoxylon truncatum]